MNGFADLVINPAKVFNTTQYRLKDSDKRISKIGMGLNLSKQ